ncbi:uncharacterized protein LOC141907818 [Tubulanus polymorphus]|uniref:uncharacterized protein LOC141907818 n=1 Tax=Tubulanus polymorphus TaxID=672921 RepID=UPI003DA6561E
MHLKQAQGRMKTWYDKKARNREFKKDDKVLVLFPLKGHPFKAKFHGPYVVQEKVNDVNYIVSTPDRRKATQLCHVNMLKRYIDRPQSVGMISIAENNSNEICISNYIEDPLHLESDFDSSKLVPIAPGFNNSKAINNIDEKVCHLGSKEKDQLLQLINDNKHLFTDQPGLTSWASHDVDVGDATPIKQHHYRVNPQKGEIMKQEVISMIKMAVAEPSESEWSSPCLLVPKPGGMAGYYRKFCKNFAQVTVPLTELLKKDAKFDWSETCEKSFQSVKHLLMSTPILAAPNFDKQFKLTVDASDSGAGAVLAQDDDDGLEHPLCFFSKNCETTANEVQISDVTAPQCPRYPGDHRRRDTHY